MNKKLKTTFIIFVILWFIGIIVWYLHSKNIAVLNPAGMVATKERRLMLLTAGLGMLIVLPVYAMTFAIAWRYREGNEKAKYSPEFKSSIGAELVWWGIPTAIIIMLSVIAWNSSHTLDPHQALPVSAKSMNVEVIALNWKWLFIYPEQGIASVNFVQFPVGTPVNFYITADAPMNSFWIPQLGGQIYAMAGMSTQLHLVADKAGTYNGSSANISGAGFSGMLFTANATTPSAFDAWVQTARSMPDHLDMSTYNQLAHPSQNNPVKLYSSVDSGLYNNVLLKYMGPGSN